MNLTNQIKKISLWTALVALSLGFSANASDAGEQAFNDVCRACHQKNGHGIQGMQAPAIAGLPRWYVSQQLRAFSDGSRGAKYSDSAGKLMANVVQGLDAMTIALIARYVQKQLEPLTTRKTLKQAAKDQQARGKMIYQSQCESCHGAEGQGQRVGFSPPLILQQDWYLLAQIEKFSNGIRQHKVIGASLTLSYVEAVAVVDYLTALSTNTE